jgi:hypothetical protein
VFPHGIGFAGQRQGQEILAHGLQFFDCLSAAWVHRRQTGRAIKTREAVNLPLHVEGLGEVRPAAVGAGPDAPAVEVI